MQRSSEGAAPPAMWILPGLHSGELSAATKGQRSSVTAVARWGVEQLVACASASIPLSQRRCEARETHEGLELEARQGLPELEQPLCVAGEEGSARQQCGVMSLPL